MTTSTSDFNEARGPRKYRSAFRITREMLEHYFGIPEGVSISHIEYDQKREVANFYLTGERQVRGLYEVGEAQEAPLTDPTEWMEEATRRRFNRLNDNAQAAQHLLREEE